MRSTWLAQQEAHVGRDEKTYITDPAASPDAMMYVEWFETFRLADRATETSSLLHEHPHMLKYHIQMVPDLVTNEVFWTRYFWQCKKIELDADRRAALVQRAAQDAEEEEEEGWGEDWGDEEEVTSAKDPSTVVSMYPIVDESEASVTGKAPSVTASRDGTPPGSDDCLPALAPDSSGIEMHPSEKTAKKSEATPAASRYFRLRNRCMKLLYCVIILYLDCALDTSFDLN